ncbi:ABC transporter substrate-binding protein [Breznakiella homolactica]|uniref:Carbohydrate ABC transporter substrate-binding protein n=1 Tax=Breznakiella homolactica TaxID=2798577 RepID=A0A7T8BA00_9SPIR|nr:ABC transporter substrate-binding protein [Breznakiella homolactica]QQO07713.1 ABC transporter substrate-binding protein [Breznakiella homolactica]
MKKILGVLLIMLIAGSLLISCGGKNSGGADKKYDLVFWVYSDFVQDEAGRLMNKWIQEFTAENENCNSITMVPKNDNELLTGLMAGVGLPDMFSASARNGKQYREAVGLLDLKPMFDADPEYTKGFYPKTISTITVDGGMWAIPFISGVNIIFRNLTVLEAAGIDPAEGIPTYDAFIEQLKKVKAAGYDATHSWVTGSIAGPGSIMASDSQNITIGVANGKTTIQPSQLVRTFDTLKRIIPYSNAMTSGQDITLEAFKTNKLAYMLGGAWNDPGIAQSGVNYDIVLVPPYEKGGWTGGLQSWDFIYGTESNDPVKNELVLKWLKKLGSYESQKAWTMNIGRSTLRQDVMDDPEVINNKLIARVSSEGLKCGMPQMDFMHSAVFWPSAVRDVAPLVANGTLTSRQAAEKFVEEVNKMYAESGE